MITSLVDRIQTDKYSSLIRHSTSDRWKGAHEENAIPLTSSSVRITDALFQLDYILERRQFNLLFFNKPRLVWNSKWLFSAQYYKLNECMCSDPKLEHHTKIEHQSAMECFVFHLNSNLNFSRLSEICSISWWRPCNVLLSISRVSRTVCKSSWNSLHLNKK